MPHFPHKVQHRRYHCINMSDFRSDLKNTSFVKSLANAVAVLYEQYVQDLGDFFDKERKNLQIPIDMQSLRRQFERTWRRAKNPLNRSRLIAKLLSAMHLLTKISQTIIVNWSQTIVTKLWHVLRKTLNRISKVELSLHESDKTLVDQFAPFISIIK